MKVTSLPKTRAKMIKIKNIIIGLLLYFLYTRIEPGIESAPITPSRTG